MHAHFTGASFEARAETAPPIASADFEAVDEKAVGCGSRLPSPPVRRHLGGSRGRWCPASGDQVGEGVVALPLHASSVSGDNKTRITSKVIIIAIIVSSEEVLIQKHMIDNI